MSSDFFVLHLPRPRSLAPFRDYSQHLRLPQEATRQPYFAVSSFGRVPSCQLRTGGPHRRAINLIHEVGRNLSRPRGQNDPTTIRFVHWVIATEAGNGSKPECTGGCVIGKMRNIQKALRTTTPGAGGIEPAPDRKRQTTWKTFIKSHWDVLASIDFTTIEVWTKGGLATFYLLFVMEVATRRVHFAGCTPSPHELWMKQMARNLTDPFDGWHPPELSPCQLRNTS